MVGGKQGEVPTDTVCALSGRSETDSELHQHRLSLMKV